MSGIIILVGSAVLLILAYIFYGGYLAKKWGIDKDRKTPAHEMKDGVDYVPAKRSVLFGHNFSSIAGAGPINGPIIAAMFGWVPVLLWILIGGIFFGAVQDFTALYASVKNKGKSIGYIIELYIGKIGKTLFLLFVWLFSILVVAAFADIVAGTFNGFAADGGVITANASVATTSIMFIVAAVILGFILNKCKINEWASTGIAIALLVICIVLGLNFPLFVSKGIWLYFVFIYIMIASVTPVWALLQPRDYLNSFLLIAMIIGAFLGIFIANPTINIAAFNGFVVNGNYLIPILFVTIACGAVSGFHALVASGTVSKQINNEADIKPIGFGSMLLESFLAVISLIAVGALAVGGKMPEGTPPVIFATAVSGFLMKIGLPENATYTIITLAISAFALTSLDSVARVGRLSFQELFPEKSILANKYVATVITLVLGYVLSVAGYEKIWPLFGSANQLLAALALIACAVFLKSTKRQGFMLYFPMGFMLVVTFTALIMSIVKIIGKMGAGGFDMLSDGLQLIIAVMLLGLGVMVAYSGIRKLMGKPEKVKK